MVIGELGKSNWLSFFDVQSKQYTLFIMIRRAVPTLRL